MLTRQLLISMTILIGALAGAVAPVRADDNRAMLTIGSDVFAAGRSVAAVVDGAADLFLAGETVSVEAPTTGTAHLAGRRVTVDAGIGQNLYAFGASVELSAPVAGNVTAAGYGVEIDGPVGGSLRAAGTSVTITGPVSGYAMLAGKDVRLESAVSGDATIAADAIRFGPEARVAGVLTIWAEDPDAVSVPDWVAPEDRVQRRTVPVADRGGDWAGDADRGDGAARGPMDRHGGRIADFAIGVAMLALATLLVAVIARDGLGGAAEAMQERPGRSLWIGFLGMALPVGASILLVLTLIGILALPVLIVLAVMLALAGGIVATWAVGEQVLGAMGRLEPESVWERLLCAVAGALVVQALMLVPYIGWLIGAGLVLAGAGGLVERLFRPRFFADPWA